MDDLSDLIDCMDYGFHQSLSRAMMMRSDALKQVNLSYFHSLSGLFKTHVLQTRKSEQQDIDLMEKVLGALDSRCSLSPPILTIISKMPIIDSMDLQIQATP